MSGELSDDVVRAGSFPESVAGGVLKIVGHLMASFDSMLIPLEPDEALD
ncbi:hypothetical protein [Ilumatobacter sp.]